MSNEELEVIKDKQEEENEDVTGFRKYANFNKTGDTIEGYLTVILFVTKLLSPNSMSWVLVALPLLVGTLFRAILLEKEKKHLKTHGVYNVSNLFKKTEYINHLFIVDVFDAMFIGAIVLWMIGFHISFLTIVIGTGIFLGNIFLNKTSVNYEKKKNRLR